MWLYPATLPSGGTSIMLKTLLSSACANDCRYCPLRSGRDTPRHTLAPEEVAGLFLDFVRRGGIHGLFLTSGVLRDPDYTMDRLVAVAALLRRKHAYRGYLHLKIIPGASDAAIEEALALASAVSLNVEAPKRSAFAALSTRKDFDRDIVRPLKLISRLTGRGQRFAGVKQTTQFIVGASTETDADLIQATWGLYRRLHLARVYFSAYQRGLGDPSLPGERADLDPQDLLDARAPAVPDRLAHSANTASRPTRFPSAKTATFRSRPTPRPSGPRVTLSGSPSTSTAPSASNSSASPASGRSPSTAFWISAAAAAGSGPSTPSAAPPPDFALPRPTLSSAPPRCGPT